VEVEGGQPEVKPQVRLLLSDAFERRDTPTEMPGKKMPSGWLARQKLSDGDKQKLKRLLDEPGDSYCCQGTNMSDWPQRGLILDLPLLWGLAVQLPQLWDEVTDVVTRIRRVLSQHPDKVDQMIHSYVKARNEASNYGGPRYN
jgi:hypothetical protein